MAKAPEKASETVAPEMPAETTATRAVIALELVRHNGADYAPGETIAEISAEQAEALFTVGAAAPAADPAKPAG